MTFRLAKGERSAKYRPGQFVSAAYAARYAHKVVGGVPEGPPIPEEPPEFDYEYEITVEYEG